MFLKVVQVVVSVIVGALFGLAGSFVALMLYDRFFADPMYQEFDIPGLVVWLVSGLLCWLISTAYAYLLIGRFLKGRADAKPHPSSASPTEPTIFREVP